MKKHLFTAIAFTAFSISFLVAQGRPNGGTPPTAAQMVANRVARLTTLLTLSSSQQTDATTIFTNEQTAVSAVTTSLQTARTALQTAVQKNDLAGMTTQSTQIGNLTSQLTLDQAKADAAFFAILSPEQQTKLTQLQANGHGFGGVGGPGGFGGRPHM